MTRIQKHHSLAKIDPLQWANIQPPNFPFSSFQFLSALEKSDSLGERTGWFPLYLTLSDKKGICGALYLFIKTNSYGEYIFDWAWADAWKKAGLPYFPKITSAIPFTPATGPKILVRSDVDYEETAHLLLEECLKFQKSEAIQTSHFLFIPECETAIFEKNNFTLRKTCQYHWTNDDYSCFDDFLAALKQKKRKEIRRERKLLDRSVTIHEITGPEVTQHSKKMYEFYLSTIEKKWAHDYLTEDFFTMIFTNLPDNILLYLAEKDGEYIAATLNFYKGDTLFGRYWGCTQEIPHLHFEMCYYKPIEFAIKNKLQLFEAGAQGEHKVQRGFIPSTTYSAHWLPDHSLGDAVKSFIQRETVQMDHLVQKGRTFAYKD